MFNPKTKRIIKLAELFPKVISELEVIFGKSANIYIDWQNVIHWQEKLCWHFCTKRMKQFFDSFDTVRSVKIYTGTLDGDMRSEDQIKQFNNLKYDVRTKSVKLMPLSIDVSSISSNSPDILKDFIDRNLLSKLDLETIGYLNSKLSDLNKQGVLKIEKQKCNFDVELGMDIQKDINSNGVENFIIFSGDSDFADPILRIKENNKKAAIFSISRKVTPELDQTNILIFDVRKIKEFICWPREIPQNIKDKINIL